MDSATPLPTVGDTDTTPSVGRQKSLHRELVSAVLLDDPEISGGELDARYPKLAGRQLRADLHRERAEKGIRDYRFKVAGGRVALLVDMSVEEYEALKKLAPGGRVADLLKAAIPRD